MGKFFLLLLLCLLARSAPTVDREIMLASSQLHRETSPDRFRINSMLERLRSPLEETFPWLTQQKTWSRPVRNDDDEDEDEDEDVDDQQPPETVFVNMDVDSEENLETKYVQLRIQTK